MWGGDGGACNLYRAGFCGIYCVALAVFEAAELVELIEADVAFPFLGCGVVAADLVEFGFDILEEVFYGDFFYGFEGAVYVYGSAW